MYIVPCPTISMRFRLLPGMSRFASVICRIYTDSSLTVRVVDSTGSGTNCALPVEDRGRHNLSVVSKQVASDVYGHYWQDTTCTLYLVPRCP